MQHELGILWRSLLRFWFQINSNTFIVFCNSLRIFCKMSSEYVFMYEVFTPAAHDCKK